MKRGYDAKGIIQFAAGFSLCLFSFVTKAQSLDQIDSLERNLDTFSPAQKPRALHSLATYYRRSNPKRFLEVRSMAHTYLQDQNAVARTYAEIIEGIYFEGEGRFDSAEYRFAQAKQTALESRDDRLVVLACSSLGKELIASGNAGEAVSNLMEGLRRIEQSPDLELAIRLRINLVWAYLELKRYRDGIALGREGLSMIEPRLKWMELYFYNNMAVCYGAIGLVDSAKYYVERGIRASEANRDYHALANAHFILGTVYANAGRNDLAIQQYEIAKPFRERVGNPLYIVSDLYTLAALYEKNRQFSKGVQTGLEALSVAREHHLLLKFENTYEVLAKNYEGMGDFKNATKYYQLWAAAKDSVYQNANAQAIADMETKYQTEKKEQQIALQEATILAQRANIQRNYILIAALTVGVVLVTIIFLLIRSRLRKKQEVLKKEFDLSVQEAFTSASIQSQEGERKRVAQDLHDGMGQMISGLRFLIGRGGDPAKVEEQKVKAELILDDLHREIRNVAFNLMPQVLIRNGLVPALLEMASRVNETGQVRVSVSSFELPQRLPELKEVSLYRVVQEWVNNVLKHAHASLIQVQLVAHQSELTLTIEDDGNGFDKSALQRATGHGWKNIQSRLHLIKAVGDVDSSPGRKGTTFIVTIPWTRP